LIPAMTSASMAEWKAVLSSDNAWRYDDEAGTSRTLCSIFEVTCIANQCCSGPSPSGDVYSSVRT